MSDSAARMRIALAALAVTASGTAAHAATDTQVLTFDLFCESFDGSGCTDSTTLSFTDFDSTTGTLTGVDMELRSDLGAEILGTGTLEFDSSVLATQSQVFGAFDTDLDLGASEGLSRFIDSGSIDFDLTFEAAAFGGFWSGFNGFPPVGILSLTYTYDEPTGGGGPNVVPLPASAGFLLFGLAGLGLASRRRKG